MNKSFALIAIATAIVVSPTALFAYGSQAGTDAYLRSLGYSDSQLSTAVATENREAFLMAEGEGRVEDPLGDVLDRWGVTSDMEQPWADIERAVFQKNDETQTWDVSVSLGGQVSENPSMQTQLFVYMDTDGDKANNARMGIRVGTDAEFSVQHNTERGWYTDYRWYNVNADFWATNKTTAAAFEIDANTIAIHIPFAEAPSDVTPHWRVAMGVANDVTTQIDVAPGAGFPPPMGETYPNESENLDVLTNWVIGVVLVLLVGQRVYRVLAKKRKS